LYKFAFARLLAAAAVLGLAAAATPAFAQQTAAVVNVLYAGSLVTPMEGPIKAALQQTGITFQGQPGGSKQLANLISAGASNPDIFISVNPALVTKLGPKVASSTTFAGTSLGIAWAPNSKYASLFQSVADGKTTLAAALATPGLKLGRTDPKLDPKGEYTVQGVTMWLGPSGEHQLLGDDENSAQIFPEEVLLARLETGDVDVGFFYRTEAIARGYPFIPLPGKAALTDRITYTLAVMANPPHPAQAKAFADFILTGQGRTILERAGLTYMK
jgi:molybdate/tungstate transport system substrate-binding protein